MFKWSFLYFSLNPLSLILSLDITEKTLALSSLSPHRYVYSLLHIRMCIANNLPAFSKLVHPSNFSFSSHARCFRLLVISWPFSRLIPVIFMSLCTGEQRTGPRSPAVSQSTEVAESSPFNCWQCVS